MKGEGGSRRGKGITKRMIIPYKDNILTQVQNRGGGGEGSCTFDGSPMATPLVRVLFSVSSSGRKAHSARRARDDVSSLVRLSGWKPEFMVDILNVYATCEMNKYSEGCQQAGSR